MIVFGTRAAHIKSVHLANTECPHCKTKGSLTLSAFRKHFHIFWIPIFPIGRFGVTECNHCQRVVKSDAMFGEVKQEYVHLTEVAKGPIWQFAGLVLIALLVIKSYFSISQNNQDNLNRINSPSKGDIYEYKIDRGEYSTLKVAGTSKDSVFVIPNNYVVDKITGIYKINKPENYADYQYAISKTQLKEMFDSGEIFEVSR